MRSKIETVGNLGGDLWRQDTVHEQFTIFRERGNVRQVWMTINGLDRGTMSAERVLQTHKGSCKRSREEIIKIHSVAVDESLRVLTHDIHVSREIDGYDVKQEKSNPETYSTC